MGFLQRHQNKSKVCEIPWGFSEAKLFFDKVMVLRKRTQPPDSPLDEAKCQQGCGKKDGSWCMGDDIFCWRTRTFLVFGIYSEGYLRF